MQHLKQCPRSTEAVGIAVWAPHSLGSKILAGTDRHTHTRDNYRNPPAHARQGLISWCFIISVSSGSLAAVVVVMAGRLGSVVLGWVGGTLVASPEPGSSLSPGEDGLSVSSSPEQPHSAGVQRSGRGQGE